MLLIVTWWQSYIQQSQASVNFNLSSQEGTTQGDPLGMAMYAIGTKPLICHLKGLASHQLWYVDDSAAGGNLYDLRKWWDRLCEISRQYGYFLNSSKNHLLVKSDSLQSAESIFFELMSMLSQKVWSILVVLLVLPHFWKRS